MHQKRTTKRISYTVTGRVGAHAAAHIASDDLAEELARAVVHSISSDIQIELGGVTIHLAWLMNPDWWEQDWRTAGVEDVHKFLAGLVEGDT
jgi:hypothetical protein